MNTEPGDDCLDVLKALRRRFLAQAFVREMIRVGLFAGGVLVALAAWERWGGARFQWTAVGLLALGSAILLAALLAGRRRPALHAMARLLDRRAATRDRWTTFLDFRGEALPAQPLRVLAWEECLRYLRRQDFRPALPWTKPRELPWLLVPTAALAILLWDVRATRARLTAERAAGSEQVAETVNALEALARQAERAKEEQGADELQRIAEQLRKSAEQMEAAAINPEAAHKSALRELSALEQMVKEMQESPAQATEEELKKLAESLQANEETAAAAEAMKRGDLARAAEELEKLARELEENGDALSKEQVEKTIQEALERLAQQRQISEALRQLSEQMAQRSGQSGATNEALQQLAELLRQMQPQQGSQAAGAGKPMTEQMLKNLLAALQNMKAGRGQPQGDPSAGEGDPGEIFVQSFGAQPGDASSLMTGDSSLPTGLPGSERDTGTTATATGAKASEPAEKGADLALRGQLGEGESLSQMIPAAADNSQAQRRYRELYEAMAPAAQDAVLQEDIPLGSRFFIKRYFESIRPPQ